MVVKKPLTTIALLSGFIFAIIGFYIGIEYNLSLNSGVNDSDDLIKPTVFNKAPDIKEEIYSNPEIGFSVLKPENFSIIQEEWENFSDTANAMWIMQLKSQNIYFFVNYSENPKTHYGNLITSVEQSVSGENVEYFEFDNYPAARYSDKTLDGTITKGIKILKDGSLWTINYIIVPEVRNEDIDLAEAIVSSFTFYR